MASIRLTTTKQQDLQPLGTAGQTVSESWSVLTAMLVRELGSAHAALFAEPVVDAARGETDWYAEGEGSPLPVALADPTVREQVLAEMARLERDIAALAERKRTLGTEGDRFLAETLRRALSVPSEDYVYVLGNRPVLVAWGHAPAGGVPEQVALTGARRGSPVPMTILPPPMAPVVTVWWRRWLIPYLLTALLLPLLALLLLIYDPFGWYVLTPPQCRVAEGQPKLLAELRDGENLEAVLRAELAKVTEDAGKRHLQCQPIRVEAPQPIPPPPPVTRPPPPPPPVRPPEVPKPPPPPAEKQTQVPPPSVTADTKRADERGAHKGKFQIILAWDDINDLDLHVVCPNGEEINYTRKNAGGGQLDVDSNWFFLLSNATPVENVYFDDPAPGTYRIVVHPYDVSRTGAGSPFRVTIRRQGQPDKVFKGVARTDRPRQLVTEEKLDQP